MIHTWKELGLVSDDASVDNAAILNEALRSRTVRGIICLAGGLFHASSKVNFGKRQGLRVIGGGGAQWGIRSEFTAQTAPGGTECLWLYSGNDAAWEMSGWGNSLTGLNIWNGFLPVKKTDEQLPEKWAKESVGIRMVNAVNGPPCQFHHFTDITLCGFARGVHLAKSTHVDSLTFQHIHSTACRDTVYCDNKQTASIDVNGLFLTGEGENVFWFNKGGGSLTARNVVLNRPRLLVKGSGGSSNSSYRFEGLRIDNNATGSRLVDSLKGPMNFYCRGDMGNNVWLPPDAINVADYNKHPQRPDVAIRLGSLFWPAEHTFPVEPPK